MNQLIKINQTTMSSREIAELTGKEHSNVLADIRSQFAELYDIAKDDCNLNDKLEQYLSISFDNRGYMSVVNLDKEQTYTLVAGYNVKMRNAIVKRWQELENNQSTIPNFSNPAEAAIAWAHQYTLTQEAIRTKAEIGDRRQATAMNTASQLSKQLDKAKDFATIKRIESITGTKYNWRELKKSSVANDYPVNDVFDANYGTVKSYHADAWLDVYGVDIAEFK